MRRFLMFFLFMVTALTAEWSQEKCRAEAAKLLQLQNRIVTYSFEKLKPDDWARYNDGTFALYLGPTHTSQGTLYGIEFSGSKMPVAQVWYAIVDKRIETPLGPVTMRTLDPRILYVRGGPGGGVMRIEGPILAMALERMRPLSVILTPAEVHIPPKCTHDTEVLPVTGHRLEEGQVINGMKIVDHTTGGSVLVSPEVPFGLVGDPSGTPHLVAYGHGGVRPRIDERARRSARAMPPIPVFPRGMP